MSSYVIPVFPAASRVPPRDALAARLAELTGRFAELSAELAAISSAVASVSGKADKAPPAAAGNLASLGADGNLADSGATPESIKAAAVAEVVANAPGTMDTLKEIADILGSNQASGSVLKRILDLESGKVNKEAGKGLVAVDATLATQGAAADAKAVGDALRGGLTAWEFSGNVSPGMTYTVDITEYEGPVYIASLFGSDGTSEATSETVDVDSLDVVRILFVNTGITATRHLITPTRTSQLMNDGAPNGGGTPYATTEQIPDVGGKADKVSGATAGNLAALNAQGNPVDSGVKPSDFATKTDLPYRLVEPGKWEFSGSGVQSGKEYYVEYDSFSAQWTLYVSTGLDEPPWSSFAVAEGTDNDLAVVFGEENITATRASLPGHLLDRANNLIDATSGNVTLTLPEYRAGKLRDLLVYVDLGDDGTDPYSITFNFPSGESNTGFKAEGDDPTSATFPAPTAAGEWWYSFTECKPHKFAVSLKQLQDAPQAQGGS